MTPSSFFIMIDKYKIFKVNDSKKLVSHLQKIQQEIKNIQVLSTDSVEILNFLYPKVVLC